MARHPALLMTIVNNGPVAQWTAASQPVIAGADWSIT
jgi:hypothetical protein